MKLLIMKPSDLFKGYDEKTWKVLFLIVGIITAFFTTIQYYFFSNDEVNRILNSEINPEMAEVALNMAKSPVEAITLSAAMIVVAYITIAIGSVGYYILVTIFEGKLKFKQVISICATAFIITLMGQFFVNLLYSVTGDLFAFITNPYLQVVVEQLNLFNIWSLVLTFIGIKTMTALSSKKVAIVVSIMFIGVLIYKLGIVSLAQAING